jgi:hypothetical protein
MLVGKDPCRWLRASKEKEPSVATVFTVVVQYNAASKCQSHFYETNKQITIILI